MKRNLKWVLVPLVLVALAVPALADDDAEIVNNWAAPPHWVPAGAQKSARSALVGTPTPLPFVAITPCRVADTRTRNSIFPTGSTYGPPSLSGAVIRDFPITGQCDIPAGAKAVSFNFTVLGFGNGFLTAWEKGTPFPFTTSTLVFVPGQLISDAAVVSLNAEGKISVVAGANDADLIIDVNGYYGPGVVTSIVGPGPLPLTGDVSLTAGANVTITPSGNTLTIAATAGSGGPPSGPAGGGLSGTYPNPTVVSSSASTFEANNVGVTGTLAFRVPCFQPLAVIDHPTLGGVPFLKGCGNETFLGSDAGLLGAGGQGNTGVGASALAESSGRDSSAFGGFALRKNSGWDNTAIGYSAMIANTNASGNTAVGDAALATQAFSWNNGFWYSYNTAIGLEALGQNAPVDIATGVENTAVGAASLRNNRTGSRNTSLGFSAGATNSPGTTPITTGSDNTFLGWGAGTTLASVTNCTAIGANAHCSNHNEVRVGDASVTFIGGAVGWNAVSDARAKTDVRDLSLGLDFVLGLRPVAYRMKHGNGRTDMGFLAQDVEARLGDGYNIVGVGGDPDRMRTLRYTDLIAPLVKAIQEQQAMLDSRNARIDELERRFAAIEERETLAGSRR